MKSRLAAVAIRGYLIKRANEDKVSGGKQ